MATTDTTDAVHGITLDDLLDAEQRENLARCLQVVITAGNGEITIRIKNGKARFVQVSQEFLLSGERGPRGREEFGPVP